MTRVTIALLCIFLLSGTSYSATLYKKKGQRLDLRTKIRLKNQYSQGAQALKGLNPDVRMDLLGRWNKDLGGRLSIRLDSLFDQGEVSNTNTMLYTAYIWHRLDKNTRWQIGQMKVPFGHEYFFTRGRRPYLDHPEATDEVGLGRDIGIAIRTEDVMKTFDLDLGIFNGAGNAPKVIDFKNLVSTARATTAFRFQKRYRAKLGYSLFYQIQQEGISRQTFGQSLYGEVIYRRKKLKITAMGEYIARRFYSDTLNHSIRWQYGVFGMLALRYGPFEPYSTYALYDPNSRFGAANDKTLLSLGFNYHFSGNFRLGVQHDHDEITGYTYLVF